MSKLTIRSAAKLSAILSSLLVMEGTFAQIDPWQFDGTNVTTSANVGIGTTAPTNKLSVAGSADISNNLRVNGNDITPEVGSWIPKMVNCPGTPSDGGTDYKYQQASYVKIGRLVFVQIYIQLGLFVDGAAGPHGTGPVCMGDLPFLPLGPTFTFNALSVAHWSNLRAETYGTTTVTAYVDSQPQFVLERVPLSSNPQNPTRLNWQDLNQGSQFIVGGSYIAAQ